jgi:ubiquinone biosynthesis protein COQ4
MEVPVDEVVTSSRIRLGDAARALGKLLRDPDDTSQVFRVVEALSGKNGERMLARMKRDESGRRVLAGRSQLLDLLTDHERLMKMPEGSLGREYMRFLRSEGITAEGLKQASVDGRKDGRRLSEELEFMRDRMRDTHDLWHVVTGYKGDLIGEASLLAFIFAQTRNPGIGFIVGTALLVGREPRIRRLILQGFARGARARWLPGVAWEELLARPLDEVRVLLRVGEPPRYRPVRTSDYRRVTLQAA